jgi:hypothetical protein
MFFTKVPEIFEISGTSARWRAAVPPRAARAFLFFRKYFLL